MYIHAHIKVLGHIIASADHLEVEIMHCFKNLCLAGVPTCTYK